MIDIFSASSEILSRVGYATKSVSIEQRQVLIFENDTVIGFLFVYKDTQQLIKHWEQDANKAITEQQFGLRRAGQKAWNVYTIFLAQEATDSVFSAGLVAIEEDLSGTRKIARSGIHDSLDLHEALLVLLPLQAAPKLEAVDMEEEIRQRVTELPPRAVDAFLLASDESVIFQVFEEES